MIRKLTNVEQRAFSFMCKSVPKSYKLQAEPFFPMCLNRTQSMTTSHLSLSYLQLVLSSLSEDLANFELTTFERLELAIKEIQAVSWNDRFELEMWNRDLTAKLNTKVFHTFHLDMQSTRH